MWNRLVKGDYVPDGLGGFQRAAGTERLLQQALFLLTCRRGAFPLLPELGSRLYLLPREKPSEREMTARQYAAEAVAPLGLQVAKVQTAAGADGEMELTIYLEGLNETLEVTVA